MSFSASAYVNTIYLIPLFDVEENLATISSSNGKVHAGKKVDGAH